MQILIINEIVSHLKAIRTNVPLEKIYFLFLFLPQFCVFHAIRYKLSLVIKVRKLAIYLVKVENISVRNGAISC